MSRFEDDARRARAEADRPLRPAHWPKTCPKCGTTAAGWIYERMEIRKKPFRLEKVWACGCGHCWSQYGNDKKEGA